MEIYAIIVEALKKRKDNLKLNSPQKLRSPPPLNANVFNFFEFHFIYDKLGVLVFFFLTSWIILLYVFNDHTLLQSHMTNFGCIF
jgi:hypothetical protein